MNKYIARIGAATVIGVLAMAMPALAATTASFNPASVRVVAGQSFNLGVSVDPNGTENYVEQLDISYPANLLQVTSFNLGSNWIALTQPGYDSTDNVNGLLIKTAGYPTGFSGAAEFGIITFYAKRSGSGTIAIANGSQAFELSSQSPIAGSGTIFTVSAAAAAPAISAAQKITAVQVSTSTAQTQTATSGQVAAAAKAGSIGLARLLILIIIIVLILIGSWIYYRMSRSKS